MSMSDEPRKAKAVMVPCPCCGGDSCCAPGIVELCSLCMAAGCKESGEGVCGREPAKDTKSYLGDGAYIQLGRFHGEVILTTEDGISTQNTVVLDPMTIDAMLRYLRKHGIISDDRPKAT